MPLAIPVPPHAGHELSKPNSDSYNPLDCPDLKGVRRLLVHVIDTHCYLTMTLYCNYIL